MERRAAPWRGGWLPSTFFSACLMGLLLCATSGMATGHGPFALIRAIWEGSWGSVDAAITTLAKMTPLLLTGLAVAVAWRVNLLNIGCEGQLTLGALAAATFALQAESLPSWALIPLSAAVGATIGALWSWPAVALKHFRGTHEVITTLILNYIATYLAEYLVLGPLGDGSAMGRTAQIPSGAVLKPVLSMGVPVAPFAGVLLCLVVQAWLSRNVWGYEVTVVGINRVAAETSGINARGWERRIFLFSGALAGMAGAIEVLGVHHRFYRAFSAGYGFDGVTTAFLVQGLPGMLWLSALLMASLRAADKWLQLALGVSPNMILVIQAGVLLAAVCRPAAVFFRRGRVPWK